MQKSGTLVSLNHSLAQFLSPKSLEVLHHEGSLVFPISIAMPLCSCTVALIFWPPMADICLPEPG
jgi:hypothetical protein